MKKVFFTFFLLIFYTTVNAETYFFVGSHFQILSEEISDGDYQGIGCDVAKIICKRLGHNINIRLFPWKRAQYMVEEGKADVLIGPYKTHEREKWLDYSEVPFCTDKALFFVRPDSNISWNGDFSSLSGKTVGVTLGWSISPIFDKAKELLIIDYAPKVDSSLKKLLAKRVDLLASPLLEAQAAFARLNLGNDQKPIPIYPEIEINYNYFGFSKRKNKELAEFKKEFDRELKLMNDNGEISRMLKDKYGISY